MKGYDQVPSFIFFFSPFSGFLSIVFQSFTFEGIIYNSQKLLSSVSTDQEENHHLTCETLGSGVICISNGQGFRFLEEILEF